MVTGSGFHGLKGDVRGMRGERENCGGTTHTDVETAWLEWARRRRNAWSSGEMQRYNAEPRWRRQHTGALLTLGHESAGIKQD